MRNWRFFSKSMEKDFENILAKNINQNGAVEKFFSSSEKFAIAQLVAQQDMILSGTSLFKFCLDLIDPKLNLNEHFIDGQRVLKGQNIFQFDGRLVSILKLQKNPLNLLGFFLWPGHWSQKTNHCLQRPSNKNYKQARRSSRL